MSHEDVILVKPGEGIPPSEPSSVPGYVKHVRCEGARYHVLSWDSKGCRCSEPKCVINAEREKQE